mgnify:CR=1 FL=1
MGFDRFIVNPLNQFWQSLLNPIRAWLGQYPWLQWLVTHPLWLGITLLLLIFLVSGLIGAIGQLTQRIWIALLRSPFQLLQWLFVGVFRLTRTLLGWKAEPAKLPAENSQTRLQELLDRLDALRQEQDELLQEVKTILAEKEPR